MKRALIIKIFLTCIFLIGIIPTQANGRPINNLPGFLPEEDPYLPFAEVMPEPVGGLEEIYKRIEYPDIAKKANIQGKVYLLVMVNEKGGVDDVKVIKGLGAGCEEAAVKAVKESKYTPGKNAGAPVKVKLSLSITFKLR